MIKTSMPSATNSVVLRKVWVALCLMPTKPSPSPDIMSSTPAMPNAGLSLGIKGSWPGATVELSPGKGIEVEVVKSVKVPDGVIADVTSCLSDPPLEAAVDCELPSLEAPEVGTGLVVWSCEVAVLSGAFVVAVAALLSCRKRSLWCASMRSAQDSVSKRVASALWKRIFP